MTPYKRVICPVDGFFCPMWIFYHVENKNGYTGRLARSEWYSGSKLDGRRPYLPAWALYLPHSGILRTQAGIYPGNEKGGYMGAWRVLKCRFSRTPFITPSGRHCITFYRKLSSVFCNYFIYFIISLNCIIHELYFLCIVQRDPALLAFQLAPF